MHEFKYDSSFQNRGFTPSQGLTNPYGAPGTQFVGRFKNGKVHGAFWLGLINNGYIHGIANTEGLATGDDIVFIYPDGETALKGRFENKYMRKAKNVDVLSYGCDDTGMFVAKEFTQPLGDYEFFYDPCTNETFGGGSKEVQDPYDMKNVKLGKSQIPESGEGVIAIRDLPKDTPACYYSLFLYNHNGQYEIWQQKCHENTEKSDEYRRHCTKYSLGISIYKGTIDLPPELDINPLPNLGPKVNHHFKANNSAYVATEHPRWGLIQSVTPYEDLKAGDELFTDYGYDRNKNVAGDFPNDFPWYWETRRKLKREERFEKEALEREKAKAKKAKKAQEKTKKAKKKPKDSRLD